MTERGSTDGNEATPDAATAVGSRPVNATQLSLAPEVVGLANAALTTLQKVDDTKLKIASLKTKSTEKVLEVSRVDAKDEREHESKRQLRNMVFAGLVILLAFAFGVYGIERGLKDLVGDLVKFVVGAVLGGFGGWGLRGRAEEKKRPQVVVPVDDDEDDE
jgi:uncharacterized membrane protein